MNTITDVTGVSVPVTDQDQGLVFFTDKLEFDIRRDTGTGDRTRWVTVAAPGAAVEIALVHDPARTGHDTGIRFATPDAEAEYERLTREGVTVDELLRWPGVPAMFKFRDTDGNIYTMIETS